MLSKKKLLIALVVLLACSLAGQHCFSQTIEIEEELTCPSMTPKEMKSFLRSLLNWKGSRTISVLKSFYPDLKQSELLRLQIVVKDFGLDKTYRGFYAHKNVKNEAVIYLDCSRGSIMSWESLLAHEIAHHLNSKRNLAPWMDEMLAQLVEVNANPLYPFPRIQVLKDLFVVPGFFPTERPFQATESYAMNLLFAMYISENFRGFRAFQSLNQDIFSMDDFSRKLKEYASHETQFDWIRDAISPKSLIRHFGLAMNINLPTRNGGTVFKVPGWSGFEKESLLAKKGTYYVQPGGFVRISSIFGSSLMATSGVEVYRILKDGQQFLIQPVDQKVVGQWSENFLVLINTSLTDYLELSL